MTKRLELGRREFLAGMAAGVSAGLHAWPSPAAAEPPPETTRIRLVRIPGICIAPQYVAEDLLRAEGFTEVEYVTETGVFGTSSSLAKGEADINTGFAGPLVIRIDTGDPIVILGGVHVGCFELFGTDRVRSVRDLKGKSVAVLSLGSTHHIFLSSMAAYVGLDPRKDIHWVTHPPAESMRLLAEGKIDAYLGFPPEPQELRARKIGHVVVSSATDRPWSQYFCCMVAGNREFVRRHPVATKRALRAILKAANVCATEPDRAARLLVEKKYVESFDYALQTMKDVPYGKWREYNPEDTVRFFALRLQEVGMIRSTPQRIIAQGTDWRFFGELRRELKG